MRINILKKFTATILAILLIISICPTMLFGFTAAADSEDGYTYTVQDGNATITDVDASISGNITIPEALGGYTVTGIGDSAFSERKKLTGVTIPDNVTTVGTKAFWKCEALKSVTIGNGVTSIGDNAFECCKTLSTVTIGNSVTSIGACAFLGCEIEGIIIPDSVTSLGHTAFQDCKKLASVTIGSSVEAIEYSTFQSCTELKSITVPDNVKIIDFAAFYGCEKLTSVTIGAGVTSIGHDAFGSCTKLASIIIPDNVTTLSASAFENCTELSSITLGSGVKSIGSSAFKGCTRLAEITIPASVTKMESSVFNGCTGLTSVTIPDTVTYLGNYTFQKCTGLTHATIGGNIKSIGKNTFDGCTNLKDVQISNSVKNIDSNAFAGCEQLTDINYVGNQSDWDEIEIVNNNDPLNNAKLNCNCTGIMAMEVLAEEPKPKFKYRQNVGQLDLTVGSVKVINYPQGTTFTSVLSDLTVTGFNNVTLGKCELTLIYRGFSINMTVEIVRSQAASIEIIEKPKKLFYKTGEALNLSGGLLKIAYYDDSFEEVDMTEATLDGYDSQKYGEQTITAKYDNKIATFTVEVYTPGDIDGDKHIGALDITQLRKCLLSLITGNAKFDVNGDGTTDIRDLVRIKKLAGE